MAVVRDQYLIGPVGSELPTDPISWHGALGSVLLVIQQRDLLLADMGLGLLRRFVVADDLAEGRLREALPAWPPQRVAPPKLRAMVDFLVGQLSQGLYA